MLRYKKILYFLIFFSFLITMKLWLGWEGRERNINITIGILSVIVTFIGKIKLEYSKRNIIFFSLFILAQLLNGTHITILYFFLYLPYFIIIFLNDDDKVKCLSYITKYFAYLMVPCVITYLLSFIVDLPSLGLQHANLSGWALDRGYGVCKNHIFYMERVEIVEGFPRFNGPFIEPGHVGCISSFIIMANHYDFKIRGMKIILLTALLSLSLAAYLLLIIGMLITLFYDQVISTKRMALYSASIFIVYFYGIYYNDGNNIINNLILSRLEYDSEKVISGNNRVFGEMDLYFYMMWKDISTILWGYSRETLDWLAENGTRGNGYMYWFVNHGLMGTLGIAIWYLSFPLYSISKKYGFFMFVFMVTMFIQRCYPFWTSWIICYLYGIIREEKSEKRVLKK